MGEKNSILDSVKKQIKNASSNFNDVFYVGEDEKKRVRFIDDFEDAIQIRWHDKYEDEIDTPCLEYYNLPCPYCESNDSDLRTRDQFAWTIYNYDQEAKQIFLFAANNYTPVSDLVGLYESYGTLLDRDYTISRTGTGFDTNYQVIPMDKSKFKVDAEKYTKKEIFKKFKNIYSIESHMENNNGNDVEGIDDFDEDDFDVPF